MPRNLELKARFGSLRTALKICKRIHARRIGVLQQRDTYFRIQRGRLKLREFSSKEAELIFYRRPNSKGGRYSTFTKMPVKHQRAVRDALTQTLGVKCVVKKKRILFLFKNSRIHLDSVDGLGSFIEFEVLVRQGTRQATKLIGVLTSTFGLQSRDAIASSYSDLLVRRRS